MMDWLYDELDQSATAEFKDHLTSCSSCGEELRSLEATREAFSQLPSEEPPASVSAILLHEAAKAAPSKSTARELEEEPRGLWAWLVGLFQPIAAHPAAAAVASLVLVAGVAGTLYVTRGDHPVAQPELAREAAPEDRFATVHPGAVDDDRESDDSDEVAAPALADLEATESPAAAKPARTTGSARGDGKEFEADLLGAEEQGVLREKVARNKRQAERARRADTRRRTSAAYKGGAKSANEKRDLKPPPAANAISGTDPLISLDEGESVADRDDDSRSQRKNELAVEAAPSKDKAYRVYKESELKWAKTQRKALTQAVKKDDCRRAARIANDILDRNREYYTKQVKNSKDVKRCQWYVSDERRRRVKSRDAKRATKRKKKSGGVPSKAKAAPRQEAAPDMATE